LLRTIWPTRPHHHEHGERARAPHRRIERDRWERRDPSERDSQAIVVEEWCRDLSGSFGSRKYAFEELIAEISAAFCCASLGIVPTVRHADYLGSWLEVLREDNRAIVRAASQASKAADYILGFLPACDEPEPVEHADEREAA
jgi:antirestriction protein ArdC